ncbi:MAG: SUF system NifU family Fe-S cluster assembly protein [Patescibacteria group bacterium]|nr:SUF system NifU family Fe-S cluster assembly protein [Patescibacteria group bacterium]
MDIYRELLLDHYKHPRNFGHLDIFDVRSELHNPLCGDRIVMEIKLSENKIDSIRFSGEGCVISQASASLLTERVMGISMLDALNLKKDDILEMLGVELTPSRLKCAMIPLETLHRALQSYGR